MFSKWFNRPPKESKTSQTLRAQSGNQAMNIQQAYAHSPLGSLDADMLARKAIRKAIKNRGNPKTIPSSLLPLALNLVQESGLFIKSKTNNVDPHTTADRIKQEEHLYEVTRLIEQADEATRQVSETVAHILTKILYALSDDVLAKCEDDYTAEISEVIQSGATLTDTITDIIEVQKENAHRNGYALFSTLSEQLDQNAKRIAGLSLIEDWGTKKRPRAENERSENQNDLLQKFFQNTALGEALGGQIAIPYSVKTRCEHTMMLARSGWGKTQALEYMLNRDFIEATKQPRSVIVMESEGDMIDRLSRHPVFNKNTPGNIADRLVVIDPSREGYMPELSFFDLGNKKLAQMGEIERTRTINNTIDLYQYIFRALKGAELTEKQSFVFVQLVILMAYTDGTTFDTLIECLDDESQAIRIAGNAPPRIKMFFEKKYAGSEFKDTRKSIYQRLETFRSSSETFVRLVSAKKSNFNFLEAIDAGKIILINTSKSQMGEALASVFGRYMTALIRQASINRSTGNVCPCFFYMDEAQEYLDDKALSMFEQARKRKIGMIVAHQNLGQVSTQLIQGIIGNTKTKFGGQLPSENRKMLADNMQCHYDYFTHLNTRENKWAEFGFHIQNVTRNGPIKVKIPFGTLTEGKNLSKFPPAPLWPKKTIPRNAPTPTTSRTKQHNKKAPNKTTQQQNNKSPLGSVWKK